MYLEPNERKSLSESTFRLNGTCNTSLENLKPLKWGISSVFNFNGHNGRPKIKFYAALQSTINSFHNTFSFSA